ncbi:MAG: lysylphosphatidylglycerol synthase transmembrane domain-containing protein [Pseudomonadota bacterium]
MGVVFAILGRKASDVFSNSDLWLGFVGAQACSLLTILTTGVTLVLLNGPPVSYGQAIRAVALSVAFFLFLPSRLSDGLKPLYLSAVSGQPVTRGIATVMAERFLDLVVVGGLVAMAIVLVASDVHQSALLGAAAVFWLIVSVGVIGIVLIWRAPMLFDRVIAILPFERLRNLANDLVVAVRATVAPQRLAMALGTASLTWLISLALFDVFLKMAGSIELTIAQVLVVFVMASAGLALAIAPGGIGTFEAGFVAGMSLYGYAFDEALLLAVVVRVATMSVPLVIVAGMILAGDVDITSLIKRLRRPDARRAA